MNKRFIIKAIILSVATTLHAQTTHQWTLQECIDYALQNNISLQRKVIQQKSSHEDVLQSQAALLPSLNASTSQNATYRPWTESGTTTVANGYAVSSVDKVYYNGSYGVNANWTLWNGGKNTNTVKINKLSEEQAALDNEITANNIQEQIAQLYVQILYSAEAINVNRQSLETSRKNEERGQTMYKVGSISKADVAQLTAQRAQDEYSIVEAESNLRNYKRQLKELLQITTDEDFDVAIPSTTDEMALRTIPALNDVYEAALNQRPEIKYAQLGIQSSDLSMKVAKAGKLPTISMNASTTTNTTSMSGNAWGTQIKNNLNIGAGFSVSIPLIDGRQTKTAVNKAQLQKMNYELELKDQMTSLHSTVENYWLQAVTNQNKFKAAKVSTESAQASYDLLSEQFKQGLKNIVELMQGKDNLLMAQQNELQSKYMAILNIDMLQFYRDGVIGK